MATTTTKPEPFKKCACGRVYETRADWEKLPDAKKYEWSDGSLCEQRTCPCLSSINVALVSAMTVDELRRAVRVIDMMRESFNMDYTAPELLRLLKVCWASGWDVTPDDWTAQQIAAALEDGRVPDFEETRDGIHALGVSDCHCRGCRRKQREREAEADGDAVPTVSV